MTTISLLAVIFFLIFIYAVLIFVHLHIPEGEVKGLALEGIQGASSSLYCSVNLMLNQRLYEGRQGEDCFATQI